MADCKKPGVAFCATVVVVALVLYFASFGPARWYNGRLGRARPIVGRVYWPIGWLRNPTAESGLSGRDPAKFAVPSPFDGSEAGDEREVVSIRVCWCPAGRF